MTERYENLYHGFKLIADQWKGKYQGRGSPFLLKLNILNAKEFMSLQLLNLKALANNKWDR